MSKDSSNAVRLDSIRPFAPGGTVQFVAKARLPTIHGQFSVYGFLERATGKEHLAIVAGDVGPQGLVEVRIHSECLTGEALGSLKCDCRPQLESALGHIGRHGGIVLYLRQEGRGIGLLNKLRAYALQEQGFDTVEANHLLGYPDDLRSYACAVEMLRFFGVSKVHLLTNNPNKVRALQEAGFEVRREAHQPPSNPYNRCYLQTKARKSGHLMTFMDSPAARDSPAGTFPGSNARHAGTVRQ